MAHQIPGKTRSTLPTTPDLASLQQPLSRRTVLKGSALAASTSLLAGAGAFVTARPAAAQDDLSNTVVIALEGSPPTFDPAGAGDDSRIDTPSLNLYNTLVQHKLGTAEIEPELATRWDVSDD